MPAKESSAFGVHQRSKNSSGQPKVTTPRSKLITFNSKPREVEDLWDLYIHRPCAFVVLRFVLSLPSFLHPSPDFITYISLFLGWLGASMASEGFMGDILPFSYGYLLGLNSFQLKVVAAVIMFLSAVADCADGQLARATGSGSSWGRFLDGFCDILVISSYFVFLTVTLMYRMDLAGLGIGLLASISIQQSSNFYDKIKSAYTILTNMADAQEVRASIDRKTLAKEEQAAKAKDTPALELFLIKVALWYAEGLKVDEELVILENDPQPVTLESRRKTMRIVSFLGTGVQTGIFYCAVLFSAFWEPGLLVYGVFQGVGVNAYRYWAYQRTLRDKLTSQRRFFQKELAPAVLWIATVVYTAFCFGYLPSATH